MVHTGFSSVWHCLSGTWILTGEHRIWVTGEHFCLTTSLGTEMTMFRETSSQSCLVVSLQTSSKTGVSTILSTVPHLKSRHLIKKEVLLLFLAVPTEERDKNTFKCHNIEKKSLDTFQLPRGCIPSLSPNVWHFCRLLQAYPCTSGYPHVWWSLGQRCHKMPLGFRRRAYWLFCISKYEK